MARLMPVAALYAFAAVLLLAVFGQVAASYTVEVNVIESIESDVKLLGTQAAGNLAAIGYEVFDSGSTGYEIRLRADIYNNTPGGNGRVATIWTGNAALLPGGRRSGTIWWHGGAGNYTAKILAYRAHEIKDAGEALIAMNSTGVPESIFTVDTIRTYDDKIKMRITSSKDAGDAVVYPAKYPAGWLFEETYIGALGAGKSTWVTMRYDPALFSERSVVMAIASENGRYYSEQAVGLRKEAGFWKYLHMLGDSLA